VKILDLEHGRHGLATIGLPPLQFMLRQEAKRDKGNVSGRAPKVIRYNRKTIWRV
jgi:hypothetical protein